MDGSRIRTGRDVRRPDGFPTRTSSRAGSRTGSRAQSRARTPNAVVASPATQQPQSTPVTASSSSSSGTTASAATTAATSSPPSAMAAQVRRHLEALQRLGVNPDEVLQFFQATESQRGVTSPAYASASAPSTSSNSSVHRRAWSDNKSFASSNSWLSNRSVFTDRDGRNSSASSASNYSQSSSNPPTTAAQPPSVPAIREQLANITSPSAIAHAQLATAQPIALQSYGNKDVDSAPPTASAPNFPGTFLTVESPYKKPRRIREPSNGQTTYSCTLCSKSFPTKSDWRSHEEESHERWKKYPCPEPACSEVFWSSSAFTQHHVSVHACPPPCPHADKVKRMLVKRSAWGCGFCAKVYNSWDRRCEHVARHYESGLTKADWKHTNVIFGLLHQPLIHSAWRELFMLKHGKRPDPQPRFKWNLSTTGRAKGYTENKAQPNLQDLLEFYTPLVDAKAVVLKAYEQGLILPKRLELAPAVLTATAMRRSNTEPVRGVTRGPEVILEKEPELEPEPEPQRGRERQRDKEPDKPVQKEVETPASSHLQVRRQASKRTPQNSWLVVEQAVLGVSMKDFDAQSCDSPTIKHFPSYDELRHDPDRSRYSDSDNDDEDAYQNSDSDNDFVAGLENPATRHLASNSLAHSRANSRLGSSGGYHQQHYRSASSPVFSATYEEFPPYTRAESRAKLEHQTSIPNLRYDFDKELPPRPSDTIYSQVEAREQGVEFKNWDSLADNILKDFDILDDYLDLDTKEDKDEKKEKM